MNFPMSGFQFQLHKILESFSSKNIDFGGCGYALSSQLRLDQRLARIRLKNHVLAVEVSSH